MRIGIVCSNFPPANFEGGIAHYSRLLARQLLKRGHDLFAITSTEFTLPAEQLPSPPAVRVHRVEGPWTAAAVLKIRDLALQQKLDAVVLQYVPASYSRTFRLKWAFTRFSCQKVTAFHALWGRGLDRLFGLLLLSANSKIIATNSEIVKILEGHLPWLLKKTCWIPIGSNIIPVKNEKKALTRPVPIITYFGMLYPGKGLELILDTLLELKKRGRRFACKFIGGSIIHYQPYQDILLEAINLRRLNDVVDLLGYLPEAEVSMCLQESRFVFLPYDRGLSDRRGTFMAAIAHAKPTLTTAPVVPMSFIKNGLNVLWPETNTAEALADCAQRLLVDNELTHTLEKGAGKLAKCFTWEEIAADYECVLANTR